MNVIFADDPHHDPNVSGDPYKTLFVARLVSNLALLNNSQAIIWYAVSVANFDMSSACRTMRQLRVESKESSRHTGLSSG